jgi:hypothetical protein
MKLPALVMKSKALEPVILAKLPVNNAPRLTPVATPAKAAIGFTHLSYECGRVSSAHSTFVIPEKAGIQLASFPLLDCPKLDTGLCRYDGRNRVIGGGTPSWMLFPSMAIQEAA